MNILDGKKVSDERLVKLSEKIARENLKVKIAMIMVGDNPASKVYVRNKKKLCEKAGIESIVDELETNTSEKALIELIEKYNQDETVNGIMVQMPLPNHLDEYKILNIISPEKDVDGLTLINQAKLYTDKKCLQPATPRGIITLLNSYNIQITSKHCVVIGRSLLVGKPMGMMLLKQNATVTYCHSKTENLKDITKKADILIVAVGKAKFITGDMVKKDAVVIDVGINRVNGSLCGDCDFESVSRSCQYITPVPKGVGPMTVISLLENLVDAYEEQNRK